MTINQQPGGTIYALSPVIYHISDSAYAETNFRYKLEVYIWSGDNPGDKPGSAT